MSVTLIWYNTLLGPRAGVYYPESSVNYYEKAKLATHILKPGEEKLGLDELKRIYPYTDTPTPAPTQPVTIPPAVARPEILNAFSGGKLLENVTLTSDDLKNREIRKLLATFFSHEGDSQQAEVYNALKKLVLS